MPFARYALFHTAPKGPLADFGAAWLGWNLATGERPDAPVIDALPAPARELTKAPRKYGFHGTIKPPFRLARDTSVTALTQALAEFCAQTPPVSLQGLELTRLGRFLALTVIGDTAPLDALAAQVVTSFDRFRAPLTASEQERRRGRPLTPAQEALLQRWGYPFVLDEFKFHMTLTDRLPRAAAKQCEAALLPVLQPLLPRPFVLDALSLCGEDPDGMFHVLSRHPLSGAAS
ncbi:DUF1045 domain-containing protein [Tropicibacter oceani]|uniref:DUF1045 domain-containing protein n=1 Tax=Tropicibacter oceani TaxID=3058420 RepID=A0ABY8QLJ0_9RHOB|nr:DUF1045 domain-containing protein [Tropicibacter oceani]WGW04851.1 DUF1045 domain-containing protein [Tropicibacter oceani]